MIEVWIDNDAAEPEAFFCLPGLINLHIKQGTVSKNVTKICDLQTNSMSEAHKMFQEQLQDESKINLPNGLYEEGWD